MAITQKGFSVAIQLQNYYKSKSSRFVTAPESYFTSSGVVPERTGYSWFSLDVNVKISTVF